MTEKRPSTFRELLHALPQHPEYVAPLAVRMSQLPRSELRPLSDADRARLEAFFADRLFLRSKPCNRRLLIGAPATARSSEWMAAMKRGVARLRAGQAYVVESLVGANPLYELPIIGQKAAKSGGDVKTSLRELGLDAVLDFGNATLIEFCNRRGLASTLEGIASLNPMNLARAIVFGLGLDDRYLPFHAEPSLQVSYRVLELNQSLAEISIAYFPEAEQT